MRAWTFGLLVAVAGCSSISEPKGPPGLTGEIVARDVTSVHVKASSSDQCGVVYQVSAATWVGRRSPSGALVEASLDDLTVGRRVSVWSAFIYDTCPGISTATAMEIIDGGRTP